MKRITRPVSIATAIVSLLVLWIIFHSVVLEAPSRPPDESPTKEADQFLTDPQESLPSSVEPILTAPPPPENSSPAAQPPPAMPPLSRPPSDSSSADDLAPSSPPLPKGSSLFSEVDRLLEKLELGNIAFNHPQRLNINDTAVIHLALSLSGTIEELMKGIEAKGEREGARARTWKVMEARLSGQGFAITAVTPESQTVSGREVTDWKWEVKPTAEGNQHLHLTLSAILNVDGEPIPRVIRTFDRVIEIEVSWRQRASVFFNENWQWLWAAIMLPILGWAWRFGSNDRNREDGSKDNPGGRP